MPHDDHRLMPVFGIISDLAHQTRVSASDIAQRMGWEVKKSKAGSYLDRLRRKSRGPADSITRRVNGHGIAAAEADTSDYLPGNPEAAEPAVDSAVLSCLVGSTHLGQYLQR